MKERIIVSLTSYGERLRTLPRVLETIYAQSLPPDEIVINLADRETMPVQLWGYVQQHKNIRINRVQDTQVWKKFLPTLALYPEDMIICIDDDFLYPSFMIEEFVRIFRANPTQPVSGNTVTWYGLKCHCGCASLVTAKFFEGIEITPDIMANCKSSDFTYTWLLARKGIFYQRTEHKFFKNMPGIAHRESWTNDSNRATNVPNTLCYLEQKFGETITVPERKQPEKPLRIFYNMPWSSEKNIGKAYNDFAALVPDDAWICFMDGDTMPSTPFYGQQIEDIIHDHPEVGAFTCVTNRIGCPWQLAPVDWQSDDMRYHRNMGEELKAQFGTDIEDVTGKKHLMSGHFLCIKKSVWKAMGGAPESGMLGVDNDIHRAIRRTGHRLYLAKGLYLYHWYRGGDKSYTMHLK